jgi:hypothetical protein
VPLACLIDRSFSRNSLTGTAPNALCNW